MSPHIPNPCHLSDLGLRRKFRLALEDLRVHGSPGLPHSPGPGRLSVDWICHVWLTRHLGLAHLAPMFAMRRVDGRLLSSLIAAPSEVACNGPLTTQSARTAAEMTTDDAILATAYDSTASRPTTQQVGRTKRHLQLDAITDRAAASQSTQPTGDAETTGVNGCINAISQDIAHSSASERLHQ
ncbi:unnamed protein product, partial [Protopolystoma xenopodis]